MSAPVLENNPISQGPSSGPAQDVDGPPTRPPGAPTKDDSGISGAAKTNLASDGDPDGKASSQADEEQRRDRAARTIQRNYRGYAARKWSKRMRMWVDVRVMVMGTETDRYRPQGERSEMGRSRAAHQGEELRRGAIGQQE